MVSNYKQENVISKASLVRILVVDDFAPWRQFVVKKLQEHRSLQIIAFASEGLDAVQKAEELQPDLILLDVGLPKLNGIEVARQILELVPKCRILFVSQNLDPDVARYALSAGAGGFVVKSDAEGELLAAVKAVMLGMQYVSRKLAGSVFADIQGCTILRPLPSQGRCRKRVGC